MTAALEGGEWSAARPGRTSPRERPGTHCTGGWVGPRAGLDGQKISSPRDSIPDHPAPSQSLYRLSYPAQEADSRLLQFCERARGEKNKKQKERKMRKGKKEEEEEILDS